MPIPETGSRLGAASRVYRAIGLLLLNTVVIGACLEGAARVALALRSRVAERPRTLEHDPRERSPYYASQPWAGDYWREFAQSRRVQYHPFTVWRRAPLKGKTINIDQRGIRLTPGCDCSADAYRVFTFGGSPMWGTGSPEWYTIPAFLRSGLEKRRHGPICITNFGESGYVSTQSVIELILQLQSGNVPNVVLFFDGTNDIYTAYQSGISGVHENLQQIAAKFQRTENVSLGVHVGALLESLSLYQLIGNQVARLGGPRPAPRVVTYESMGIDPNVMARSIVRTYLNNLESVTALAARYRFDYHFFWPPYIGAGKKRLTAGERALKDSVDPTLDRLSRAVYAVMDAMVGKERRLYSLTDVFDDQEQLLWLDDTHVTPIGNEIIAERMLNHIDAGSVLDASRVTSSGRESSRDSRDLPRSQADPPKGRSGAE
jgi:lysophospholipase L1-like esterase